MKKVSLLPLTRSIEYRLPKGREQMTGKLDIGREGKKMSGLRTGIRFDELKALLLYRKIVAWDEDHIELDTGLKLRIEMTDWDCCARVESKFSNVKLDAAITAVSDIGYEPWEDDATYGCKARVTIMHNRNAICMIEANADAGNGGYYFSIASFIVTLPVSAAEVECEFVRSYHGREDV